jgi:methionyl-tRNA formyltransferase
MLAPLKDSLPQSNRPRVVLLTRDGAYSRIFLRGFLHSAQVDIVGVLYSTTYLQRKPKPSIADLFGFIQTVGLAYALYQGYVSWILPIRLRLSRPRWREIDVSVIESSDINCAQVASWLKQLNPDFLVSFHFNQKIQESITKIPKVAAINFHPSILPNWRGVDPVFFSLQKAGARGSEDEDILGGSIHLTSEYIDSGDILAAQASPVQSVGLIQANRDLFQAGGVLAAEVLNHFPVYWDGRLSQSSLETENTQYYSWKDVGNRGWKSLWNIL